MRIDWADAVIVSEIGFARSVSAAARHKEYDQILLGTVLNVSQRQLP